MAGFRQKLGDIRIPRRAGLALMASAAVLPVGLSAVGEGYAAQTSAWFGLPLVLLGALAWHGSGKRAAGVSRLQARRIARQRALVVAAFSALLGSILVSNWPREAAIKGSVALNQAALHQEAKTTRRALYGTAIRPQADFPSAKPGSDPICDLFSLNSIAFSMRKTHYITFPYRLRTGLIQMESGQLDGYGTVSFYTSETDARGKRISRLIYEERKPAGE